MLLNKYDLFACILQPVIALHKHLDNLLVTIGIKLNLFTVYLIKIHKHIWFNTYNEVRTRLILFIFIFFITLLSLLFQFHCEDNMFDKTPTYWSLHIPAPLFASFI